MPMERARQIRNQIQLDRIRKTIRLSIITAEPGWEALARVRVRSIGDYLRKRLISIMIYEGADIQKLRFRKVLALRSAWPARTSVGSTMIMSFCRR